jgi:hypothetical protein
MGPRWSIVGVVARSLFVGHNITKECGEDLMIFTNRHRRQRVLGLMCDSARRDLENAKSRRASGIESQDKACGSASKLMESPT